MEPDPRLQAAIDCHTRLTDIAQQCHDEGKARWTAALERQATMLDKLATPPAKAEAAAPAPSEAGT